MGNERLPDSWPIGLQGLNFQRFSVCLPRLENTVWVCVPLSGYQTILACFTCSLVARVYQRKKEEKSFDPQVPSDSLFVGPRHVGTEQDVDETNRLWPRGS